MELKWFTRKTQTNAFAQATCLSGTVNTVLHAQLRLSMIQRKDNATIVLKVLSEITTVTHVCQDFDEDLMLNLLCIWKFFKLIFLLVEGNSVTLK